MHTSMHMFSCMCIDHTHIEHTYRDTSAHTHRGVGETHRCSF